MVNVVFLLLGRLCHGNFCLFLVKLEIKVVLILKGVGCYCCYCGNKSFSLWFLLLTGDCYDGGRIKDKDWDYQEAGETDPRMEKRAERPIGQAKCRVGEGIVVVLRVNQVLTMKHCACPIGQKPPLKVLISVIWHTLDRLKGRNKSMLWTWHLCFKSFK